MADEKNPETCDDGAAPPDGGAPPDAATLAAQCADAVKKRDEFRDLLQRTMADFQNYKARASRDLVAGRRFALAEFIRTLLPAVDNLERAVAAEGASASGALHEGVRLTLDALVRALEQQGVTPIEPKGAAFDPACMEAVLRVPTADAAENTVLDVFEKGWRFPELVVRPARVTVAATPVEPASQTS